MRNSFFLVIKAFITCLGWLYMVEEDMSYSRAGGPYSKPGKRGKCDDRYHMAMRLSPTGPPIVGARWVVSSETDAKTADVLLKGLFKRND